MKQGLLAVVVLLMISPLAKAQNGDSSETRPFSISSLNSAFGVQGDFEGEYRIYADRIELKVTTTKIRISEHCPYQGRRLLSGVKVGLAMSTDDQRWQMSDAGHEIFLEQVMSPGDTHSLGELYFSIPKDEAMDLSKHWLVVQLEDLVLDMPEETGRKGYAFAHSCRDMFTQAK